MDNIGTIVRQSEGVLIDIILTTISAHYPCLILSPLKGLGRLLETPIPPMKGFCRPSIIPIYDT